ncbi:MAG: phosphoribosylanthranilate isomerase [Candidatus Promineifilaceae bacterium]
MTQVKICGIINIEDALVAMEAGADYLGFIMYPASKRYLTPDTLQAITSQLRQRANCPKLVGVFVDDSAETVAQLMETCQLDLAQLSGDEPPAMIGDPESPLYGRSYKALHPTSLAEAEADAEWYTAPNNGNGSPTLHMDTHHPTLRGGTGLTADWTIAAHLAQTTPGFMLAGGLNPDNVAEAIRVVRPFAVDVASGVEIHPHQKDHQKIRAFIQNAQAAYL